MSRETIEKPGPWPVRPNLLDYRRTCAEFSWSSARAALDGLPGGRGLNIAHEAVDRHAAGPLHDRVALRFLSGDGGGRRDLTYAQLAEATSRFANVLRSLGVGKGDRVFSLLGRVPELYVAALGALKNGSVFCPLFSAFGPEPIRARLALGGGKVIATTESLARRKLGSVRAALPALEHVLVLGDHEPSIAGGRALAPLLGRAPSTFDIPATAPEDVALLHFTSGTTGRPKGAMHVHEAVVAHEVTGRLALDLHEEDVFWCTADPGWVTGTSYGIVSPLVCGVTSVVDELKVHPMALVHPERIAEEEERRLVEDLTFGYEDKQAFFVEKLAEGIGTIAAAFFPKPVVVRLSDFKTNEYARLAGGKAFEPAEENPMIGFRGASRYYDERYREGFALECKALLRVREEMGLTNVIPMIPFCRTVGEGEKVIAEMAKNGLRRGENGLHVYVMAEIPNNAILIDEFSKLFDGFSIGSNDLTQLTLGVDRDSALVAHVFDERDRGVKWLVSRVIEGARRNGRHSGICGQAPSDYPEFAAFVVQGGVDSISLNPDTVLKTTVRLLQVEASGSA